MRYRHKGNGKLYERIRKEDFKTFLIKQTSTDEWENVVAYMDCETHQTYLTGEKRFNERFEPLGYID